jgi:hypothetical protein
MKRKKPVKATHVWAPRLAAVCGLAVIGAVAGITYGSRAQVIPQDVEQDLAGIALAVTPIPLEIQNRCELNRAKRIPSLSESLTLFRKLRTIEGLYERELGSGVVAAALGPELYVLFDSMAHQPGNPTPHQIENFRNQLILSSGSALRARHVLNQSLRELRRTSSGDFIAEEVQADVTVAFRLFYRFMRFQECAGPLLRRHQARAQVDRPQIATTIRQAEPVQEPQDSGQDSLDDLADVEDNFTPDSILNHAGQAH